MPSHDETSIIAFFIIKKTRKRRPRWMQMVMDIFDT